MREENNQKGKIIPGTKSDFVSLILHRMKQEMKGFVNSHMNVYLSLFGFLSSLAVVSFGFDSSSQSRIKTNKHCHILSTVSPPKPHVSMQQLY